MVRWKEGGRETCAAVHGLDNLLLSPGGPLDICTLCEVLHCEFNPHLGSQWLENKPTFTAINFNSRNRTTLFVTMPGEPLYNLGLEVRGDGLAMGFDDVFLYVGVWERWR